MVKMSACGRLTFAVDAGLELALPAAYLDSNRDGVADAVGRDTDPPYLEALAARARSQRFADAPKQEGPRRAIWRRFDRLTRTSRLRPRDVCPCGLRRRWATPGQRAPRSRAPQLRPARPACGRPL
jgi:hypothetical protein